VCNTKQQSIQGNTQQKIKTDQQSPLFDQWSRKCTWKRYVRHHR